MPEKKEPDEDYVNKFALSAGIPKSDARKFLKLREFAIPRQKRPGCHSCQFRKHMTCTGPKQYQLRMSKNGHIQRLEPVRKEWQSKCMYLVEREVLV